jgi:hypothetical protein
MFILVTLDCECSAFDIHMSVRRNIIPNYNQQDAMFLEFMYFYRRFICFRRFLRPSSGGDRTPWISNSSTVAASSSIG